MIEYDSFASLPTSGLHHVLCELSHRKLHLLTAALLRRVWDDLPSEHTRIAVEATERFADGRISPHVLARLRSTDVLDSCETLWLSPYGDDLDELLIGHGYQCCPACDAHAAEYEVRVARSGKGLRGVVNAIEEPAWIATQAIRRAREIAAWKASGPDRDLAEQAEMEAQFRLLRDIAGPRWIDPRWPRWRTSDVLGLARSIYCDRAFELLPILGDALEEAGCDDNATLSHCRSGIDHVRGCWLVDLVLGLG